MDEQEENKLFKKLEEDFNERRMYKYMTKDELVNSLLHYKKTAYLFCAKYLALKNLQKRIKRYRGKK